MSTIERMARMTSVVQSSEHWYHVSGELYSSGACPMKSGRTDTSVGLVLGSGKKRNLFTWKKAGGDFIAELTTGIKKRQGLAGSQSS